MSRLDQQLSFALEIDKLKSILRQTLVTDGSRRENSAEHSWQLAVMAMLFVEYAPQPMDVNRAIRLALAHDLVEIYAGDAPAYDAAANVNKEEREREAARRLFGQLPAEQGAELHRLFTEFEQVETNESRYVNALDRLQPLLHNRRTAGGSWITHQVKRAQVMERMDPIRTGMPEVWPTVVAIVDDACSKGWIRE